jgi:hypothetical protein
VQTKVSTEEMKTIVEDLRGHVSSQTLFTILLTYDRNLTIDDLQSQLDELGLTPSRVASSQPIGCFRHVELLREAGLMIERTPRTMTRSTQLKAGTGQIDGRSHAPNPPQGGVHW